MGRPFDDLRRCFDEQCDRMGVGAGFMEPCDLYAEYACQNRPDMDCRTMRTTLEDAEPELQDQCMLELLDLMEEDAGKSGARTKDVFRSFKQSLKQ